MAAVTPATSNKCRGTNDDDTPNIQLYCYKGEDDNDDPIYTCATWKRFRAQCPNSNLQCSTMSEAYVAAITVCRQRL